MYRVLAWQLRGLAGRRWLPLPVQVLYGALVAGPKGPGDDTYEDRRDDYVSNEVGGAQCAALGGAASSQPRRATVWGQRACWCMLPCILLQAISGTSLPCNPAQVAIDYNAGFTGALAGLLQVTP